MPVHTQAHISMYVCVYTLSEFSSFSWGWLFIRSDAVMSALATAYLARLARFDCRLSVCVVWVWGGERHVIAWNVWAPNAQQYSRLVRAHVARLKTAAIMNVRRSWKTGWRIAHSLVCVEWNGIWVECVRVTSREVARSRWNSSHLRLALSVLRAAFTWTTLKRNGTHSRTRRRKNKTAVKQR